MVLLKMPLLVATNTAGDGLKNIWHVLYICQYGT